MMVFCLPQAENCSHPARRRRKIASLLSVGEKYCLPQANFLVILLVVGAKITSLWHIIVSLCLPQAKNFGILFTAGEKLQSFCSPQAENRSFCSLQAKMLVMLLAGKFFGHFACRITANSPLLQLTVPLSQLTDPLLQP